MDLTSTPLRPELQIEPVRAPASPRDGGGKIKAPSLDPASFKRAHARFRYETVAFAQVLIPEETFKPTEFAGRTVDVSAMGMKLCLEDLPTGFYTKLLPRSRYIRVRLTDPAQGAEIKITGRIVSIDYHKPQASSPAGTCFFGVQFDPSEGGDFEEYSRFIERFVAE